MGRRPVAEDYPVPNGFTGEVNWVEIDVGDAAVDADHRRWSWLSSPRSICTQSIAPLNLLPVGP